VHAVACYHSAAARNCCRILILLSRGKRPVAFGIEVRPILLRLLQQAPCAEVINAISAMADDECLVTLGRIARTRPDLEDAAREALDSIGSPGAMKIAAASRRLLVVARRQLTDRSKRAPGSKLEMLRSD
jgi:hypothetical protein